MKFLCHITWNLDVCSTVCECFPGFTFVRVLLSFNSVPMALFSGMRPSSLASVDKSNFSTEQNVSLFCYNRPKFIIFLTNIVIVWKENLLGLPLKRKQMVVAASPPREDAVVSAEPLSKEDLVDYLASGCKPKEMWR